MTLILELTAEEEARLSERAAQQGQDAPTYALGLVRRGILGAETMHSIMELEGQGVNHRRGEHGDLVDAQEYVNSLRDEWDHRP